MDRIPHSATLKCDARSQKRKILGVLFDWDGTLLNSYAADSAAYLAMFQQMEIAWGLEDLARHYSPNWYNVYRAAGLHESRWAAADLAWRAKYATQKPQLLAARGACWRSCASAIRWAW